MEGDTAFWLLSTIAQVLATSMGFLLLAAIFWMRTPVVSPRLRYIGAVIFVAALIMGTIFIWLTLETLVYVSGGTVSPSVEATVGRSLEISGYYLMFVAIVFSLIILSTVEEQAEMAKKKKEEIEEAE